MSTFYLNVELVEKKPPTKALPPGCRRQVTFIIRVPLIGKFLFGGLYLLTLLSPPLSLSLSLCRSVPPTREDFKRYYPIHFSRRFSRG